MAGRRPTSEEAASPSLAVDVDVWRRGRQRVDPELVAMEDVRLDQSGQQVVRRTDRVDIDRTQHCALRDLEGRRHLLRRHACPSVPVWCGWERAEISVMYLRGRGDGAGRRPPGLAGGDGLA